MKKVIIDLPKSDKITAGDIIKMVSHFDKKGWEVTINVVCEE